jgi:hypothetical protein
MSTFDDQGDNSISSAAITESTLLNFATGLQELSQQFTVMQEGWCAMKSTPHSPPSTHRTPPSHQFHTPNSNNAYVFHTRATSHFNPQHHPTHD